MNQLETLQQKSNGIIFIKSYPILNQLPEIVKIDKEIIELTLSYQDNDKILSMSNKTIASLLNVKIQSVKNSINKLKKIGILNIDIISNFNGTNGGSSSLIKLNMNKLIELLNNQSNTIDLNEDNLKMVSEHIQEELVAEIDSIEVIQPTPEVKKDKEILPILKVRANKLFHLRDSETHFDKQIEEMTELLNELNIKYISQLTPDMIKFFQIEIKEDGFYRKEKLFKLENEIIS